MPKRGKKKKRGKTRLHLFCSAHKNDTNNAEKRPPEPAITTTINEEARSISTRRPRQFVLVPDFSPSSLATQSDNLIEEKVVERGKNYTAWGLYIQPTLKTSLFHIIGKTAQHGASPTRPAGEYPQGRPALTLSFEPFWQLVMRDLTALFSALRNSSPSTNMHLP